MTSNSCSLKARIIRRLTLLFSALLFAGSLILAFTGELSVSGQITINEINPNQSTLDASDPDGASGGRINGLASVPTNNNSFYAASEWGGLYRSNDGGLNWARLNNHRPTATWDVEVSQTDANRVFATSFYDGRVTSLAGINVSTDGGNTWAKPATATPPAGFCANAARRNEPSAFGISIDPANAQNVYIGTNCGLAISNNGGTTWTFVDPTPADGVGATDVWDVVVHHGGIIDTVGADGHRRSTDGGTMWTTATGTPLPSGRSSVAASPDEANVIFATVGNNVWESDNGGGTWTNLGTPDSRRQGRIPFVAVNDRTGDAFDLWYGDVRLFRGGCTSNPAGGGLRCPVATLANPIPTPAPPTPAGWAGPFTRGVGGHDDVGDIVFDTAVANNRCPRLMSSDGGVYFNTNTTSPGCHAPTWEQPNVTPHGLWLFGMNGADQGGIVPEDLYFGCQDNGTFAATDAGAALPTWFNRDCCDGFDISAEPTRVVYTVCCGSPRANRLYVRNSGMTGGSEINTYPAGNLPGFGYPDVVDRFAANSYVLVTTSGVFVTTNIGASPVVWTQLGAATSPAGACGVRAVGPAATPTFYVQSNSCSGRGPATLSRYDGTAPGGTWTTVNPPGNVGGFAVITADQNNANRVFAAHVNGNNVNMVLSTNGGMTWTMLAALDDLMTGNGTYLYRNTRGSAHGEGGAGATFQGYPQPTFVAIDPADGNIMVAGGADSGVFLSTNGGVTWTVMTDNSGGTANPHVPRPRFAYFDHEGGNINIYIGTQGRGVWRFVLQDVVADLAVTKTAAPSTVTTGTNVSYTITITNNGPNAAPNISLADVLHATTTFVSCAVSGGVGGACGGTGNNRTATFTSLANGASATVTLVAQVNCSVANATAISNTVTVGSLASDPNGSNNTAQVGVTASNPPPIITCPANINVGTDPNQCFATVNPGTATAMDNCPGVTINGVRSDGQPLNATYPVAVTTITWTATDSGGRTASCQQTVTVTDTQPPVITCPADVVAVTAMPGVVTTVVNYPPPTVMDNCPNLVVACVPPSGSVFALGTTIVNCKVTDISNNMATCNFKVTVYDVCLQDDSSGDYLLFNSLTGDYQFTRCGPAGFTSVGKGMITRTPCLTMLNDAKVSATLDRCIIAPLNRGKAIFKPNPIGGWHYITDSNIFDNTCVCP